MSHRGMNTQKWPQASVRTLPISSVRLKKGQSHHHGLPFGKKPQNDQSVSSTVTVAYGTPSRAPVVGFFFTTRPQIRRKNNSVGSIRHRNESASSPTLSFWSSASGRPVTAAK